MKKLLVFFVALCMLFSIAACKQPADKTDQTGTTQDPTIVTQAQAEQEIKLNWEPKFLRVHNVKLWENDAPKIDKLLDYETFETLKNGLHKPCNIECFQYDPNEGLCVYAKSLENLSYSKEFFENNSLILVGLSSGSGSTIFQVTDVSYTNGVITCSIDIPYAKDMFETCDMASWYCFVAVDTVLPADTQISVNTEAVEVDLATYEQANNQFNADSIY